MDIEEQPTIMVSLAPLNSPGLANPDKNVADETSQGPVAPAVSPISTPLIIATNDIHGSMSPLSIYDHVASQSGVLDGGTSTVSAAGDAAATDIVTFSDEVSQNPPTHNDLTVLGAPNEDAEVSRDSLAPEDVNTREDQLADNDLLDPGSSKSHIETAVSDSGIRASPDPEPASSSVKGTRSKRRMKPTVDLDSLPNPEDELTDAEIANLCCQPPRIRQRYTNYFASHGVIRAAYCRILFERLPDGELRFPEEVLRSCIPKWKERLEVYEPAESSHAGAGPSRKRKGTVTAAKRSVDDDADSRKHSPKKARKATASKSEELQVDQPISEASPLPRPVPTLRIRPVISRRTALSMGLPPGLHSSQPSTFAPAGSSDHVSKELSKASASTHDPTQNIQSDSAEDQHASLDVPNMDTRRPFFSIRPTQSTHAFSVGSSQLLDPNYLGQFAQNLTGEIQQLDLATVAIVRTSHDQGPYWRFRNLRDTLVHLRDQCVDIEARLRKHLATKDQD
ncbi:uncharacterized protein N7496_003216 [Penicillium cataractarum]|uniref:Uncharacterized protein n=1 Tax=Penicillium cataractarum TaxID=2100454 RepID=A0A9W9SQS4_9EURO|nr:uncharacterized protein N7496_003216 [Penicillium cataractarum]KAJ5380788.1 hypothetical protein N7496_003216 [Penicillium cataractarum]